MLAQRSRHWALVRSLTHTGTNHGTSAYHMLTGHLHPNAGPGQKAGPHDMPTLGCSVAQGFLWSPAVPAAAVTGLAACGTAAHPRLAQYRGERNLVDEMLHQIGFAKEGPR